ncbi:hypothetical protein, partial [Aeromonas salmonicida]
RQHYRRTANTTSRSTVYCSVSGERTMQEIIVNGFTAVIESFIAGGMLCAPFYLLTKQEK